MTADFDYWEGWRVTQVVPPQRRGDWWRVLVAWGPILPIGTGDQPDYFYTGSGQTRDAAIADIRARCAADPKWNTIAEPFA
jgi:hypothetical protein